MNGGPGQEPLPVVRIWRHLQTTISRGAPGRDGIGFPPMPVGRRIA
jgi:hypothetical protein